jgi:cytochrome b subunit of formate dehydrogenase
MTRYPEDRTLLAIELVGLALLIVAVTGVVIWRILP